MLLDRKEFKKVIDDIWRSEKFVDKLNDLLYEYDSGEGGGFVYPPNCVYTTIELLRKIFKDEDDNIGYFIYELQCGEEWEPGCITNSGHSARLKTVDDLYDYLIANMMED